MSQKTVLQLGGLHWATSARAIETTLTRRPGVETVEANAANQTATVTYDPDSTSVAELSGWVRDCGYHCSGQSVPEHVCEPMREPSPDPSFSAADVHGGVHAQRRHDAPDAGHQEHTQHDPHSEHDVMDHSTHSPHEMMGHGGHAGMSMADMARDMRNRFLVALVLTAGITLWSPMGRDMFGFTAPTPFGLRDDVFALVLSLPVVFYSAWIFFDGAWRALRNRTLDMMVLVAVAVAAGWLYSVGITLTGGGEVFYEAAAMLTTFVLLGHWFEMRARGGANDAIRALMDLAPPKATVIRDGKELEIPTADVVVGDLVLIRPGGRCPSTEPSRTDSPKSTSPW